MLTVAVAATSASTVIVTRSLAMVITLWLPHDTRDNVWEPVMIVLIAGAGPTGLTLACELARRGVACRVVDKAPGLFAGSRGKGLTSRTQEVFDDLGVSGAVLAGGMPFPKFRMYAGHSVVSERTLAEMLGTEALRRSAAVPYPGVWLIPQWRTDKILADRLVALGGRVEFDTELTGFTQDDTGVTATLVHN
ncbi:MAG: FAD-dependent monooxygenase [Pseudonocardiaceae bacterium]